MLKLMTAVTLLYPYGDNVSIQFEWLSARHTMVMEQCIHVISANYQKIKTNIIQEIFDLTPRLLRKIHIKIHIG